MQTPRYRTRTAPSKPALRKKRLALGIPIIAVALLLTLPQIGAPVPPRTMIEVLYTPNGHGVSIDAEEYLFDFLAEDCQGRFYETNWGFPGTKTYDFFLNDPIVKIWVTAGWNETNTGPSGPARMFENEGVECAEIPVFPSLWAGLAAIALGAVAYRSGRQRK